MADNKKETRIFEVFRYDPAEGGDGRFDRFELEIDDPSVTTILDVLFRIQREVDPTIAFRYACRVAMCGSCGMVINGSEGLACKTVVSDIKSNTITLRPLNHFPVIKDLVVDMSPFFDQYEKSLPYFEPSEPLTEPAVVRPDTPERKAVDMATDCIACGCCVSSCTMVHWHENYLGPAALNRSMTLLMDRRDGLRQERLAAALDSCYNCRLEFNCTDVCPKEISPTRAIKLIHRMAVKDAFTRSERPPSPEPQPAAVQKIAPTPEMNRRRFLSKVTVGLGAAAGVGLCGLMTPSLFSGVTSSRPGQWIRLGPVSQFIEESLSVHTVTINYDVTDGFYERSVTKPVLVGKNGDKSELIAFNSRCTHLGCTVRWDQDKQLFLCACHGGVFFPDGRVKAGPAPRPLDRYATKVENGGLFIMEA